MQFLRHDHRDLISRQQALVRPVQVPARGSLRFFGGRERVVREVNVFEVCFHAEEEIAHLRNLTAAEAVAPFVKTLRAVADGKPYCLTGSDLDGTDGCIFVVGYRDRIAVNDESEIVVDCLARRELQSEIDRLFLVARISKTINARELDFVSAVPQ